MKKLIGLLLTAALIFALAGCGVSRPYSRRAYRSPDRKYSYEDFKSGSITRAPRPRLINPSDSTLNNQGGAYNGTTRPRINTTAPGTTSAPVPPSMTPAPGTTPGTTRGAMPNTAPGIPAPRGGLHVAS